MVAVSKEVEIKGKKIKCYDLTYGYLLSISPENPEKKHETIMNGTDLSEAEVMELRASEGDALYHAISMLTYPNLYNEDGTQKDIPDNGEGESKKKV